MSSHEQLGVLLVNTGSPASPDPRAVREYLARFLTDPRIAPMPPFFWQIILKRFILGKRSVASGQKYAAIWTDEGSPLDVVQRRLAEKLNQRSAGRHWRFASAMSYSHPFIDEGLAQLIEEGCTTLIVLPLYPQSAFSTVGAVKDKLAEALRTHQWATPVMLVDGYADNARYRQAMEDLIRRSDFAPEAGDRLILSYHSIPRKDIKAGDTYVKQVRATSAAIIEELGLSDGQVYTLFQSRFDNARSWQGPFLRQTLTQWAQEPFSGSVYVVCPNFSVDCLETLNEIERELAGEFLTADHAAGGLATFRYLPCLNDSDDAADVVLAVIEETLAKERGDG